MMSSVKIRDFMFSKEFIEKGTDLACQRPDQPRDDSFKTKSSLFIYNLT